MTKLSELTQEDIYDIAGIEPEVKEEIKEFIKEEKERHMASNDFVEIHGAIDGLPATARFYMELDDVFTIEEYGKFVKEMVNQLGIKVTQQQSPQQQQGGGGGEQGTGCPVHGLANKSDSKRQGKWTCKAFSVSEPEWASNRWTSKDGSMTRYYCTATWA